MLSTKDSVLSELMKSPGNAVSGAELARDLKVTRNAVWKAVSSLKNDGYNILSTAKGYALRGECDIINKQRSVNILSWNSPETDHIWISSFHF